MAQKFIVPITVRQLASAGSDAFTIYVDQDVYSRIQIQAGGRIVWGSGDAASDTNLYRDAPNVLKTDDTFKAAGLFVSGTEIDPTGATSDQVLKFNGTKFVPGTASTVGLLNDLSDVTTASVATGDVLTWNGTYWTNEEPTGGGASVTVSESAPASPAAGDLWFDSILGVMFIYYDDVWVEVGGGGVVNFVLDTVTAKGDLIVGTADGAADNLAVGANGTYLKANSSTATGLEWASVPTVDAAAIISAAGGDGTNGQALTTNGSGVLDFTTIVGTTEASIISAVGADGAAGSVLKTNGSGDLSFGDVALGTNTSGIYVADLISGTGVTITNGSSESASPTIAIGQAVGTSASVTFAHVTAPVTGNLTGNLLGDVTGNADTATALETTRTISLGGDLSGSASFDGTSDITISASVVNSSVSLDEISDVVITSPLQFQGLMYDGTNWVNSNIPNVYLVRNNTGSTILKGTLVGAVGAEPSGRIDVAPFQVTGTENSELRAMGIATSNISSGVNGEVMSFGTLTGLDTRGSTASALAVGDETWAAGDILFAHPTIDGKLTNVRPQHDLAVAFITVRHASSGQIAIRIIPGNNHLEWMHDVSLVDKTSGDFLKYNGTLWVNDQINLGTDTVGNYLSDLTQGTGVTITHTPSEGSNATIAIGQAVDTSASVTFAQVNTTGDVVVGGNLTVNGTTTTLNTETLSIEDNIVVLNSNVTGSPTTNAGIEVERGTSPNATIRWNETSDKWEFTDDGSTYYDVASEDFVTSLAVSILDDISDVSASAAISGDFLKYDGAAWVNDPINLGTDTVGNYMLDITAGTGISVSHTAGEGSSASVSLNATLDDLSNVNVSAPTDGYFLKYVSASSAWVPAEVPTINALDDIGDVSANYYNNQPLVWNGAAWTEATSTLSLGGNANLSYADISTSTGLTINYGGEGPFYPTATFNPGQIQISNSDNESLTLSAQQMIFNDGTTGYFVDFITSVSDGKVLKYDNELTTWSAQTLDLDDLSNVSASAPSSGQFLKWNGSAWIPETIIGGATISATAPSSPSEGAIWFNSTTLEAYVYYDGHWLQASGEPDLVEDLTDLSDVLFTAPISGQFLKFDGTRWVNGTIPTINTLDDIGDVSASAPPDGYFLKYVSASSSWVPAAIPTINALDDIGDVSASVASPGQFLKWNGTAWVPETIIGGATISDTAPAAPLAGQLWFDSTVGKTFVYYDSQWIEVGGVGTGARMVSSSSAPASPLEGSMWFDTDTAQTFVYYDSSWIEIGASGVTASVQDSAPAAPVSGQIWFNSLTGGTYVYYGTNWIEVGASPFSALVNTINAKGDLLVGTADNTIGGLTAGSDGQVLTVDSSTGTGLKWDTPVSTGKAIAMSIVFGS